MYNKKSEKIWTVRMFLKGESCTVCAGMCKILTKEFAKVHSMKYKEYVQMYRFPKGVCWSIAHRVRCRDCTLMKRAVSIGGDKSLGQWGFWALLMRPAAVRKKLFLWCEVLVLMDHNLLPDWLDAVIRWQVPLPYPVKGKRFRRSLCQDTVSSRD